MLVDLEGGPSWASSFSFTFSSILKPSRPEVTMFSDATDDETLKLGDTAYCKSKPRYPRWDEHSLENVGTLCDCCWTLNPLTVLTVAVSEEGADCSRDRIRGPNDLHRWCQDDSKLLGLAAQSYWPVLKLPCASYRSSWCLTWIDNCEILKWSFWLWRQLSLFLWLWWFQTSTSLIRAVRFENQIWPILVHTYKLLRGCAPKRLWSFK